MEALKTDEAQPEVEMPDVDPSFGYMVELFSFSGQCSATGMGLVPLSWTEINNWIQVNSLELTLWEIETIKQMSDAYCSEYSKSSDPQRQAPYQKIAETMEEEEQIGIQKGINFRNAIRLAGKKK